MQTITNPLTYGNSPLNSNGCVRHNLNKVLSSGLIEFASWVLVKVLVINDSYLKADYKITSTRVFISFFSRALVFFPLTSGWQLQTFGAPLRQHGPLALFTCHWLYGKHGTLDNIRKERDLRVHTTSNLKPSQQCIKWAANVMIVMGILKCMACTLFDICPINGQHLRKLYSKSFT